MVGEIQVTEGDIAEVLRAKVNEITGLHPSQIGRAHV